MTSWPAGELGPSPDSRCRPESWAKVELWDFWAESRTIIVAPKKIKESHPAKIEVTDWSIFLELYAYRVVRFRFLTSSVPQSPVMGGWPWPCWWMFPGFHPSVREEIIALNTNRHCCTPSTVQWILFNFIRSLLLNIRLVVLLDLRLNGLTSFEFWFSLIDFQFWLVESHSFGEVFRAPRRVFSAMAGADGTLLPGSMNASLGKSKVGVHKPGLVVMMVMMTTMTMRGWG